MEGSVPSLFQVFHGHIIFTKITFRTRKSHAIHSYNPLLQDGRKTLIMRIVVVGSIFAKLPRIFNILPRLLPGETKESFRKDYDRVRPCSG